MNNRLAVILRIPLNGTLFLLLAFAILCLPGCGSPAGSTSSEATLESINVSPANQSVPVGGTLQFSATGHYSDGTTQDLTGSVTWTSSDTSVATISNSSGTVGLATGVAKGSTTISAQKGTPSGETGFNVTEPITAIVIAPQNPSVASGIPQQFTATATYADDSTADVTSMTTWSSSVASVATISNVAAFNGLASTLTSGSTTILGSIEGFTSSTSLMVNPPAQVGLIVSPQNPVVADAGATIQLKALAQFSDGSTQDVTSSATWSTTNSSVAGVSSGGLVTSASLPSSQSVGFASVTASVTSGSSSFSGVSILGVTNHSGNGFVGVFTQHNDISRTGENVNETTLTTSLVGSTSTFGKLFSQPVDGELFAQPLYVPNVTINGVVHNVIYAATEGDSVYAFDADSNSDANSSPLWKVILLDQAHGAAAGATTVSASGNANADVRCGNITPQLGVTATPVIDPSTNTMYVAAESKENGIFVQRLHALDIATGAEKSPGPMVVSGAVPGTADGSTTVTFNPLQHLSRPGLLLLNGVVYIAYASNCDFKPYHGWLFAYDAGSFAQKGIFNTTPNGGLGGIWMSGAGIAADSNGNLYVASGNGDFDTVNVPAIEFGDSILKLNLRGNLLTLADYFTPYDQDTLDSRDVDLGSGGLVLLPDQSGTHPHLLVQSGKEGTVYLVDRDRLTQEDEHYCPKNCDSDPEVVQELLYEIGGGMWSMPAYWNNNVYFWGSGDSLTAFGLSNGALTTQPTSSSTLTLTYPGSVPAVSSNGTSNGIVWAIDATKYTSAQPGILHAYDATNVAKELYNSQMAAGGRDTAGAGVKYSVPTVANGKVYVGTQTELDVYGPLPQ